MPGRKRSEMQGEAPRKTARSPAPKQTSTGQVLKRVYCPTCGLAHGPRRLNQKRSSYESSPAETINHWQRLKDRIGDGMDSPYGIIQEVKGGRGQGFTVLGHFGPEDDDTGSFPLLKERILLVLERWVSAGWITPAEVRKILAGVK